jgi:hypothetical protein
MALFPTTEPQIMALAASVKSGLQTHAEIYPTPPVSLEALSATLVALQAAMDKVTEAKAAAEVATEEKLALIETLITQLKKELRYAEDTVDHDDAKLKLLGWAARKERGSTIAPGQPRRLTVVTQDEGSLKLVWLVPAEGGKVTCYTVQRRLKTEAAWTPIVSTYERTITLTDQPRNVELEYSIIATNKTGDGPMSNTVMGKM